MASLKLRTFRHRRGVLVFGLRTRLMGIVNITPDSFSDGGQFATRDRAVEHAMRLIAESADIIDLGAESTRPGSQGVEDGEQLERLLPVLRELRGRTEIPISIDTRSAVVARECLEAGADIINDVAGLRSDAAIADYCVEYGAGLVVMHMRGDPATMQRNTEYADLISDVRSDLLLSVEIAMLAGLQPAHVMVDPGLGFGKSFDQNYSLIRRAADFRGDCAGVLLGPSRKAFTGEFSGLPAAQRQFSTAAVVAIAALYGGDVLRVHDVAEMRQVTDMCDRYRELDIERN
ncbi:MAG: dihydropteroate synthase [bacterium]|nr:dihydropteroate synthase [bacterium]